MRLSTVFTLLLLSACSSPVDSARIIRTGHLLLACSVWSRANDNSSILASLPQHTTVSVTDYTENGWTGVRYGKDKESGFIITNAITPAKYAHPKKVVGKYPVPLRENPADHFPVIKGLPPGTVVGYLDNNFQGWAHVYLNDGTWGFIREESLKF